MPLVELKHVDIYQSEQKILSDVSFSLQPSEFIYLIGATGSGKSSMIVSLLRLVELDGGSIIIDGMDISKIGLSDLRSNLSWLKLAFKL